MKIKYNKKLLKRMLEVSIPICIITASLSGCSTDDTSKVIVSEAS